MEHPDPHALAGRLLADAGLEPGSLVIARADVEQLVARAFAFGGAAESADEHERRFCRICGCTQIRACPGACSWVGPDLCSACEPFVEAR
jgi:hypothetical protein